MPGWDDFMNLIGPLVGRGGEAAAALPPVDQGVRDANAWRFNSGPGAMLPEPPVATQPLVGNPGAARLPMGGLPLGTTDPVAQGNERFAFDRTFMADPEMGNRMAIARQEPLSPLKVFEGLMQKGRREADISAMDDLLRAQAGASGDVRASRLPLEARTESSVPRTPLLAPPPAKKRRR